jgi:hypothetical protein
MSSTSEQSTKILVVLISTILLVHLHAGPLTGNVSFGLSKEIWVAKAEFRKMRARFSNRHIPLKH